MRVIVHVSLAYKDGEIEKYTEQELGELAVANGWQIVPVLQEHEDTVFAGKRKRL